MMPQEEQKINKLEEAAKYAQQKFNQTKDEAVKIAQSIRPTPKPIAAKIVSQLEKSMQEFQENRTDAINKTRNGCKTIIMNVGCDKETTDLIKKSLNGHHQYMEAETRNATLDILKELSGRPLTIIVNQILPDGTSGIDLIRTISAIKCNKIVLLSETITEDIIKSCIAMSCQPLIVPLDEAKFKNLL